jgi:AcrR family transcriptional regulator
VSVTDVPASSGAAVDDPAVAILDVTAEMLATEGFDGLLLREVARQARVSLATIYKHFGSRDGLIIAAVERWMAAEVYRPVPEGRPDEPLADVLIRTFRHLFAPWERHPIMLAVFLRAALLPGGDRLAAQGEDFVLPMAAAHFAGYDAEFADDVSSVLTHMTHGIISRFASGTVGVGEIISLYERAVHRLTDGAAPVSRR